jgi:hypothetical protein
MEAVKGTNGSGKRLLTYARHKHVAERYQYWTDVKRRREDDVIAILKYKECFLEEKVIYSIIKGFQPNSELDKLLKSSTPGS